MLFWDLVHRLRAPALAAWAQAPACRREAEAFRAVLAGLPIGLPAGALLAGEFGPEWDAALAAEPPPPATPGTPVPPSPLDLLRDRYNTFGGYTPAHTTLDYGRIVAEGLGSFARRAQVQQSRLPADRQAYAESMAIALEAVCQWSERYACLADAQAARSADGADRERLQRLAEACRRVPRLPARTFAEGLQSVWLVHAAVGIAELCQASLSLGSLDQYLLSLFQAEPDRRLAQAALRDLFDKLNRYGDAACALNLGGADAEGRDLFNPLSALIVETVAASQLPAPLLAARITARTPPSVLDGLCRPELAAIGQPTFYGEESCVETLRRRGVPEAALSRWCANSCMGLYMPGEEISDMWGGVVNTLIPLELALNGGRPLRGELPLPLATPALAAPPRSLAALQTAVQSYLREFIAIVVRQNRVATEGQARERPNPFLSALTADCIERGLDRAGCGAHYHSVIIEGFGLINTADALCAIDELVFREKRLSLDDLTQALARDFAGQEDLRQALLAAPKFGRGEARADGMARWLADAFAEAVVEHRREGVSYLPSFHTLNAHIWAGAKTAASADGRHAGDPLAKNLGPMLGGTRFDHTAVLLSCAAVDPCRFSGGQAVDLSLDAALLGSAAGRSAFQALLRTYFDRGGTQVQINGVTPAVLRAAMADPARHAQVTVRIAGYSARFVTLPPAVQEEMLRRIERGL